MATPAAPEGEEWQRRGHLPGLGNRGGAAAALVSSEDGDTCGALVSPGVDWECVAWGRGLSERILEPTKKPVRIAPAPAFACAS